MATVAGLERSQTSSANPYDHAINLIDSTSKPKDDDGETASDSVLTPVDSDSSQLNRQWTRPHLRKELARRKYAKWQEEVEETDGQPRTSLQSNGENTDDGATPTKHRKTASWSTHGRLRDMVPFKSSKRRQCKVAADEITFVDVLYENQRGSFLCGIPLYSANSLLNFDPSGWQTATFQDSPVDISNAQVPDPSWVWEWRSWYVDMSHDVDEEGWEYSFSFSPKFSWHGNHPWFHSFCRRRRWLRKRVKANRQHERKESKSGKAAHRLTADYFTIHAARQDRSRSTSGERSGTRRSSTVAGYQPTENDEEEITEISNVSTLMTAIKRARVDREKITAVNQFLSQGGDEIHYLADDMSTIMDDFVHETSRRQMQTSLVKALNEAITAKDDSNPEPDDKEARQRRVENLRKAVNAAGIHTNDKNIEDTLKAKAIGKKEESPIAQPFALDGASKSSLEARDDIAAHIEDEAGIGNEIKGISKDAEISMEPGIRRPNTETEEENIDQSEEKAVDKGKGKE